MRKITIVCLIFVLVLSFAGCTREAPRSETLESVMMLTYGGTVGAGTFSEQVWEGLYALDKKVIHMSYVELESVEDFETKMYNAVMNSRMVWISEGAGAEAALTAAETLPYTNFAVLDALFDNPPANLIGVSFRTCEGAFLAGYIAGKTTKTNAIGFIGGMNIAMINEIEYGYRAGALVAAKETGKQIEVKAVYTDTFEDKEKGSVAAKEMYDGGADIIFQAAARCGIGVIETAKQENKYVIGIDTDQSELAPQNVLTSVVRNTAKQIEMITENVAKSQLVGGENFVYGLADGGVDLAQTNDNIDPQVYAAAMEMKQKIIEGSLSVPKDAQSYTAFEAVQ